MNLLTMNLHKNKGSFMKNILIATLCALQPISLLAMQPSPASELSRMSEKPKVRFFIKSFSAENLHSSSYFSGEFDTEDIPATVTIPTPPTFKAQAKKAKPPFPEKPKSFLQQHKKKIIYGGIGVGALVTAGAFWQLTKANSKEIPWYERDYYVEEAK